MIEVPKIASPVVLRIVIEVDQTGLARIIEAGDPRTRHITGAMAPVNDVVMIGGLLAKMAGALIENRPRGNSAK